MMTDRNNQTDIQTAIYADGEREGAATSAADAMRQQARGVDAPPPIGTMAGGVKHDQDKPRMDLLDRYAMEQLALVLGFGAKKYAAHNWRNGIAYSRLTAAALRHVYAFNGGEDVDAESGLPHLAHAMCCLMFLLGMTNDRPDMDDRYKKPAM